MSQTARTEPPEVSSVRHVPPAVGELENLLMGLLADWGPRPESYAELNRALEIVHEGLLAGDVEEADLARLRSHFDDEFRRETLPGHALEKPFGYSGDYLMIDKVYVEHRTRLEPLVAWDEYFQRHPAAQAVRNRKAYFKALLRRLVDKDGGGRVLSVGSGPCRGLREFREDGAAPGLHTTCVDLDRHAIRYADRMLRAWRESTRFVEVNVLRYRTEQRFDLVWSAGLFDYLADRAFVRALERLWACTADGGTLVVGNFSTHNPSRAYMEILLDWTLFLRTPDDLRALAERAGIPRDVVSVHAEELGINLFLHAEKG